MIKSAKNCLSQIKALVAVQENNSWWKTLNVLWSLYSLALLLSLKSQTFMLRKCLEKFSLTSKISRQLF